MTRQDPPSPRTHTAQARTGAERGKTPRPQVVIHLAARKLHSLFLRFGDVLQGLVYLLSRHANNPQPTWTAAARGGKRGNT